MVFLNLKFMNYPYNDVFLDKHGASIDISFSIWHSFLKRPSCESGK